MLRLSDGLERCWRTVNEVEGARVQTRERRVEPQALATAAARAVGRHGASLRRKRGIADEAGATLSRRVDDAQRDCGSFGARGRDVDGLGAKIGLEVGDRFVEVRS